MRKRQPLADATALSTRISLVESRIVQRQLTTKDADEIESIVSHVRELERGKIILAPQLLQRVKALASVARRLRTIAAEGGAS